MFFANFTKDSNDRHSLHRTLGEARASEGPKIRGRIAGFAGVVSGLVLDAR